MNSTSTHFVPPRRVGIYEPLHQFGMWGETFKNNIGNGGDMNTPSHIIIPNNQKLDNNNLSEDTSQGTGGTPHMFDQEASTSKHPDKIQRRLAQNREAARKSRLRKKAYVQQLETSRLKLIHLEQELDRARQQGFYVGNGIDTNSLSFSEPMNPGIAAFEMEYGHWIQEQNKQICELRTVLQGQVSDVELRLLVENGMKHYFDLFRMKSAAAKADVLLPHFDVMTDQQILDVCNLRQSCQQAEDALSQGMEKLQHTLADCVAGGRLGEGSYIPQVNSAMERLEALVSFVNQADHLRHETLQQMRRILTTRQAARGLLALGSGGGRNDLLLPTMLSLSITSPGTAATFLRGASSATSTSSSFHGVRIRHEVSARVPAATVSSSSGKTMVVMMSKREAELKDIRGKTTEELNEEVIDLKGELFMLRLQKSARNEFKSSDFRRMKKQVARILTVRREREIEEGIGKRLSRKLDRQWKKSIVVRPPPSLKKLQEEEAAEEAAEAAKSA
ncbi:hypothetical protein HID58_092251 [Brassica napus]|uniref:BZIP domain-containing protein n=2 Tax=Brassica TaxID=3705 RepID=A0ABQ7WX82_BRANA|nr:hypothetical protein HID58_092251 [Brassica napus]